MGKTARSHRGRVGAITPLHKRVLVVYNGKITEKQFLKRLQLDLRHGVLVFKYRAGDIGRVIKHAAQLKDNMQRIDPYDKVFVMADVDECESGRLSNYVAEAEREGIILLLSNPCIEVAISCYAGNVTGKSRSIKGAQAEAKENGMMSGKEWKEINANLIADHLGAAEYALTLKERFGEDISTDSPNTDVFELIHYLRDEFI